MWEEWNGWLRAARCCSSFLSPCIYLRRICARGEHLNVSSLACTDHGLACSHIIVAVWVALLYLSVWFALKFKLWSTSLYLRLRWLIISPETKYSSLFSSTSQQHFLTAFLTPVCAKIILNNPSSFLRNSAFIRKELGLTTYLYSRSTQFKSRSNIMTDFPCIPRRKLG